MEDRNQDGHAQICGYERARRLVSVVEVSGSAETQINRYDHQSCAVGDCNSEGPEPQLRWSYSRQHPRMASVEEPKDAEPNHQETGADLNLSLPFDDRNQ